MAACRLPVELAVLHRADALHPAEALGEVAQGGEPQHLGDQGQWVVGLPQEEPALRHAPGDQVADGGGVELLPEGVREVVLVDVQHLRQLVQG